MNCKLCNKKLSSTRNANTLYCHACRLQENKKKSSKYRESRKHRMLFDINYRNKTWYTQFKSRAKRRGLDNTITNDEFLGLIDKPCHYCSDPVDTIGIDRVDSSKGYHSDNVVRCCITCNKMKLNTNYRNFLDHVKKIYNTHYNT